MPEYIKKIRTDKGDKQIDYTALANLPGSMKNPYPITFTGGASATYDGSAGVEVEIPQFDHIDAYTKQESDSKYANKNIEKKVNEITSDINQISYESSNILDFNSATYGKEMSSAGVLSDNENGILFKDLIILKKGETKTVSVNKPFNWKGNYAIICDPNGNLLYFNQFSKNSEGYLESTINNVNSPFEYVTVTISVLKSKSSLPDPENDLMCVVNADMPQSFEAYGRSVQLKNLSRELRENINTLNSDVQKLKETVSVSTWYAGKRFVAFGDSITAMALWFNYVKNYLSVSDIVNRGIGGTTVHNNGQQINYNGSAQNAWMCSDERIAWLPEDADVVLVMGGMNDWSEEIAIGEIATGNDMPSDTTFIGAYQIMLSKLIKKYPNAKIFTMTVTNGRIWSYPENKDVPPINWGKTTRDFADATIKVSNIYGIPCIDLNGECGFSFVNSSEYTSDGTHPNDNGAKLMASQIIRGLLRYEPIDF